MTPPPATDWKEVVPEGEAERLAGYAEQLRALQRRRARRRPVARGLHAKAQAGLEAEFTVLSDLPAHARVGLFAAAKTYRAYVRYSNGAGVRQADAKPDVRGIAIKVVGVPGKKIIPGLEDAKTQDFLMIRTPATPFRSADEFVWFVLAAVQPATLLPRALLRFGPLRTLAIVRQITKGLAAPALSLAATRYFSAAGIQFGAYAVRCALEPTVAAGPALNLSASPEALREDLLARLVAGPVVYDFRVQFFVDERRTPIEDAAREWREADAPFVTVARLTLPRQDPESPRGRRIGEWVETLSFDPWHALEAHRPLGNLMRARNHAYRLSTAERGAASEPDGSERFD